MKTKKQKSKNKSSLTAELNEKISEMATLINRLHDRVEIYQDITDYFLENCDCKSERLNKLFKRLQDHIDIGGAA
jgi:chromosome condensin MukBEF ATPase and DNA-binding subunit MukB